MPELSPYCLLRNKPSKQFRKATFLSQFYDKFLAPGTLLGLIGAPFLAWQSMPKGWFTTLSIGSGNEHLYGLMLILTVLIGARLIQSIWLANRDYQALQADLIDVVIFLVVIGFTSGGVFLLRPFGETRWIALIYFFASIVGVANFGYLYASRLPKNTYEVDWIVERRIQAVNVLAFTHLSVSMMAVFILNTWFPSHVRAAEWIVASVFLSLLFNMLHSQQMTDMPKFLFHNDHDASERVLERFHRMFPRASRSLNETDLRNVLLGAEYTKFRLIKFDRATRGQAKTIVDLLMMEFGYVFRFIFDSEDDAAIKRVLGTLTEKYSGFGSLGFSRFYSIVPTSAPKKHVVGYVQCNSRMDSKIYEAIQLFSTLPIVAFAFGFRKLPRIYHNMNVVVRSQPRLEDKGDLCLNYLMIKPEERNKGYGSSAVRMLINALEDQANGIPFERILVLSRTRNEGSHRLFEGQGFVAQHDTNEAISETDPFPDNPPMYFQYILAKK
jgi:GNAT superfamily N-acetyltransferase